LTVKTVSTPQKVVKKIILNGINFGSAVPNMIQKY